MDASEVAGRRIGEVAAATGQTIRALHHYDQLGLVSPAARTRGGHRLYHDTDVRRLCAVVLLRRAGMSTAAIAQRLTQPDSDVRSAIAEQLDSLEAQITALGTLRHRLAAVLDGAGDAEPHALLAAATKTGSKPYSAQKAVALLPYASVRAARDWLVDVFGLEPGPAERGEAEELSCASVVTGQGTRAPSPRHSRSPDPT